MRQESQDPRPLTLVRLKCFKELGAVEGDRAASCCEGGKDRQRWTGRGPSPAGTE